MTGGAAVRLPLLSTASLELWLPQADDLTGLCALLEPEEIRRHLGAARADPADQFARLLRNAGSWSLYGYGTFVVRLPGEPRIIGSCGLFRSLRGFGRGMDDVVEAGWIIDRRHWGRGLASEAMRAALGWFDRTHGPQRITCMIEAGNTASERIAHLLGFHAYDRPTLPDGARVTLYERARAVDAASFRSPQLGG